MKHDKKVSKNKKAPKSHSGRADKKFAKTYRGQRQRAIMSY